MDQARRAVHQPARPTFAELFTPKLATVLHEGYSARREKHRTVKATSETRIFDLSSYNRKALDSFSRLSVNETYPAKAQFS